MVIDKTYPEDMSNGNGKWLYNQNLCTFTFGYCGGLFILTDIDSFSIFCLLSKISLIYSYVNSAYNFSLIVFYERGSFTCDFLYDILRFVSVESIL